MHAPCPPTAFLTLETACDGGCAYCFYTLEPARRVPATLDLDAWCGVIDALAIRGLRAAIITGGEPTRWPGLPRLVAHASGLGIATVLLTGRPLDPTMAAALRSVGLSTCVLSAHRLAQLEDALDSAEALGAIPCSFTWVITTANARELPAARAACRSRSQPLLLQPAWVPEGHPNAGGLDPRGRRALQAELEDWTTEAGLPRYGALFAAWMEGRALAPTRCGLGREALVVDADGTVMPCHQRRDLAVGRVGELSWDRLLARLSGASAPLSRAPCFGGHCLPLHLS